MGFPAISKDITPQKTPIGGGTLGKRPCVSPNTNQGEIKLKCDISPNQSEIRRKTKIRDKKRLRKLVESAPKYEEFLSCSDRDEDLLNEVVMSQIQSQPKTEKPIQQLIAEVVVEETKKSKPQSCHMLSGSEFDELDAQLEQFLIAEEEGVASQELQLEKSSQQSKEESMSPTQPNLLSQHAEVLKVLESEKSASPCQVSQSIEQMLGDQTQQPQKIQIQDVELGGYGKPTPIANNEAISNSSSPIVAENIRRSIEMQANQGKIELLVDLTEEQKKQQESLSFGVIKTLSVPNQQQLSFNRKTPIPIKTGIGYGQNIAKNQQELIEIKRQGQQGVQRAFQINSQVDLLDMLASDSHNQQKPNLNSNTVAGASAASSNQSRKRVRTEAKQIQGQQSLDFFMKKSCGTKIKQTQSADTSQQQDNSIQQIGSISDFRKYQDWCSKNNPNRNMSETKNNTLENDKNASSYK